MDAYEATQLVFARVQAMDPENVSKIIGFFLLQERSEQEMARLALGSDLLLHSAIAKARRELGLSEFPSPNRDLMGFSNELHHLHSRMSNRPSPLFIPDSPPAAYGSNVSSPQMLHPADDFPPELLHDPLLKTTRFSSAAAIAANAQKRHQQLPVHSPHLHELCKPCLYYSRGFCKHGTNCRFLHGSGSSSGNSSPQSGLVGGVCSPVSSPGCNQCSSSLFQEEEPCSSSLERLELELQELLRGRRTPVSIASLPQLYFEKFGKALQAQGYLTESQRHGKSGCSLTKLLARLKGSVTLIDRPHGQHAVVLAEDASRFIGYRADRDDLKEANPCSRQIYLTFPAESTFTEDDVSAHFRAYGPVQDVRIPYQQKRMFGFVTFVFMETVKTILAEGNPHYICGARVLVKPYREKARPCDRKQLEKIDPIRGPSQFRNFSGKDLLMQDATLYDAFARRLDEERLLELERRRIMDFHRLDSSFRARVAEVDAAEAAVAAKQLLLEEQERINSPLLMNGMHVTVDSPELPRTPQISDHNSSHGLNETMLTTEDMQQFQSSNPFGFVMDVLEGEAGDETEAGTSEAKVNLMQEQTTEPVKTDDHNLPDSPFASPVHSTGTTTTTTVASNNSNESLSTSPEQVITSLTLQEKMMGLNLNDVLNMASVPMPAPSQPVRNDVICCICLQHCVEPSKLECSHTFCVQCILKVIRGSKDECPICRQHIGSQVYKILQNRDLQSWLSPTLSHRVPQHIW